MAIKVDPNANYIQYGMTFLPWNEKSQIIASRKIDEEGLYRIVFQAQVVNNTLKWGKNFAVMIEARLLVDDTTVKMWVENILPKRHYGIITIIKDMELKQGSLVHIKMRGDRSAVYPPKSVFVLMSNERFQFDVTKG